jgi:hypothetical protein
MKKYITVTVILLTVIIITAAVIIGITGAGDNNGASFSTSESTTASGQKPNVHTHDFNGTLVCGCGEAMEMRDYFILRLNYDDTYSIVSCRKPYSHMVIPSEYRGRKISTVKSSAFEFHGIECIEIPESISVVEDGAFSNCPDLREVRLPDNLKTIETNMFSNCQKLESVIIPEGLETIERNAFENCKSLKNIVIPESLALLEDGAFFGCDALEVTVHPEHPKYYVKGNCIIDTDTASVVFANALSVIPADGSVTSIGNYAFSGMAGIEVLELPGAVTSIGVNAFAR